MVVMRESRGGLVLLASFSLLLGLAWGYVEDHSPDLPRQFLDQQNAARARLGLPPLQWSSQLAKYAQWWADRNARYYDCSIHHSGGPYGENIFWGSGKSWFPRDAVRNWVNERSWYDYRSNSCRFYDACGHYTQIVWRTTRQVGCARTSCPDGRQFMTCNYYPRGNYQGQRPY